MSPRHRYSTSLLLEACPARRQNMASRAQLLACGLTKGHLSRAVRAGDLVWVGRAVYALAPLAPRGRHLLSSGQLDLGYLAVTRAALLSLNAVADRRTAALVWGMDLLVEPTDVECRVGRSQRRVKVKGIDARASSNARSVQVQVHGLDPIEVSTATDTVLDCAIARPLLEAVVIADSALRVGCVTVDDLVAAAAAYRGPRRPRILKALALIDPASGSVLETMLRVLLLTNGLHPLSQFTVLSGNRVVGRFDFCFDAERLIIECDGRRWHDSDDARRKDRHRDNSLQRLGWRILRFDWDEVRGSPSYVLAAVRDCLELSRLAA